MSGFPELAPYLVSNKHWASAVADVDVEFFPTLAKGQAPPMLWLGCADSRVPESVVMARKPGEVFVHRNIANQFQLGDDSANAVVNYAVMSLGVTHVVVVGHTSCGGCLAAWDSPPAPSDAPTPATHLGRFLAPLIHLRHSLPDGSTFDDLIRENVRQSVDNVVRSETIQSAWAKNATGEMNPVYVHGWLYDLKTGLLTDLDMSQGPPPA